MKTPEQTLLSNLGPLSLNKPEPEFHVYMEWGHGELRGRLEYAVFVREKRIYFKSEEGLDEYCPKYSTALDIIENLNKYGDVTTFEYFPDETLEENFYEKGKFRRENAQES